MENQIVKGVKKLAGLLELCISYLFPKDERICVFGAWQGQRFSDNSKYLFLESEKRRVLRNIWITKNREVLEALHAQGFEVYLAGSMKGVYYQLRAGKAVVCSGVKDVNEFLLGGKKLLQLWHGVPLKKIMYDAYTPNWIERVKNSFIKETFVVCTSENFRLIYERAFGLDEEHVLVLGQPRNDLFYDSALADLDMKKCLDALTAGRKIILYMPTHRSAGKIQMNLEQHFDFKELNAFCGRMNAVFIINKHFCHREEKKVEGYKNIIDITDKGYDSQQLLIYADLLITDYSSCYIDYLLRERPVVFYQYDLESYKQNERELYFYDSVTLPGPVVKSYKELQKTLETYIMEKADAVETNLLQAKDFFYAKEAQRAVSGKVLDIWERQ